MVKCRIFPVARVVTAGAVAREVIGGAVLCMARLAFGGIRSLVVEAAIFPIAAGSMAVRALPGIMVRREVFRMA